VRPRRADKLRAQSPRQRPSEQALRCCVCVCGTCCRAIARRGPYSSGGAALRRLSDCAPGPCILGPRAMREQSRAVCWDCNLKARVSRLPERGATNGGTTCLWTARPRQRWSWLYPFGLAPPHLRASGRPWRRRRGHCAGAGGRGRGRRGPAARDAADARQRCRQLPLAAAPHPGRPRALHPRHAAAGGCRLLSCRQLVAPSGRPPACGRQPCRTLCKFCARAGMRRPLRPAASRLTPKRSACEQPTRAARRRG